MNGEFVRSYAELLSPDGINPADETRYLRAVKYSNAFKYNGNYCFLIEGEAGVRDAARFLEEDD